MRNQPDNLDKRMLDPNEAAALLGCTGNTESFASRSRNQDFHLLFPDISPAELLCDDFSCAWQREVLLQGRLYLTQRHFYFYSKILWVYRLVIPLKEIHSIEKRNDSVSGIFPNSITIKTEKEEYFFASFVTRELTFVFLMRLWKNISRHQTIPMKKLNYTMQEEDSDEELPEVSLDTLKRGSFGLLESESTESIEILNSLQTELSQDNSIQLSRHLSCKSDSNSIPIPQKPVNLSRNESTRSAPEARTTSFSRKYTNQGQSLEMIESRGFNSKDLFSKDREEPLGLKYLASELELPALRTGESRDNHQIVHKKHIIQQPVIDGADSLVVSTPMISFSPISCDCNVDLTKYKILVDHSFKTPVENLWKILFGSVFSSDGFMKKFWADLGYKGITAFAWEPNSSCPDINARVNENMLLEDMRIGYVQKLEYLVPSTNPIGPKEIHTFVKNQVISKDINNPTICILQISTTPFITSGDCFEVQMRTCLTHDGYGRSKLRVAVQVVFIKSTWIRMIIDKAATDALSSYFQKLVKGLESHFITVSLPLEIPKTLKEASEIPTLPFVHHPLENELNALKEQEKTLGKQSVIDLQIWSKLSSIDMNLLMIATLLYMSYWLFVMNSEIILLKQQLQVLLESVNKLKLEK